MKASLVYPHQLFSDHPALRKDCSVFLIEDPLFFSEVEFHPIKIEYHRTTMHHFAKRLSQRGFDVTYISEAQASQLAQTLRTRGVTSLYVCDPVDDFLERKIYALAETLGVPLTVQESPQFLCTRARIDEYFSERQKLFFTDFYIEERKRHQILTITNKKGVESLGGSWSFDKENRKKLPKDHLCPKVSLQYPTTHEAAASWLDCFITERLALFGDYEDAISKEEPVVYHGALTPMLNNGLLTPRQVVDAVLDAYKQRPKLPLNTIEGFIRQVIGWREFMRGVYVTRGRKQRTGNYFHHQRKMPPSFYDGTTGLAPLDHVIKQVQATAYCHHIERLMVLGNVMLLCELHPTEVYRWFMELFIDAYDWVMVPNVYAMSQYADGGGMTTKPYISSSNYILKMSNHERGPWCDIWDGLYWRFIEKHRESFAKNHRMSMMVRQLEKLEITKKKKLFKAADAFLESSIIFSISDA